MSWDKTDKEVVFYCDGPDCEVTSLFDILETRDTGIYPQTSSDFAVCWNRAQGVGWRSFKKPGGRWPWEYFCPKCAAAAAEAQRRHNEQENERERIKQRNARYL